MAENSSFGRDIQVERTCPMAVRCDAVYGESCRIVSVVVFENRAKDERTEKFLEQEGTSVYWILI